jgi:hypothetical protein
VNSRFSSEKATVCQDKTCVIVFGDTAKLINEIALTATIVVAVTLIVKAIHR